MTSTPQKAVLAAVDELHGVLSLAEALFLAGRAVDLQGLDREVASLCAAAATLPPDQGRATRQALVALLAQVDELQTRFARP
jgi:hypothetical protein